ncbi:MAG: hypothetical protein ACK2T2_08525 [Anaerolineales bacterium]
MKRYFWLLGWLAILLFALAACSSSTGAPAAIETYLRALEAKDDVAAVNASCLNWEQGAFAEASSFEAVDVTLEGLSCAESGSLDNSTLVKCEGTFVANYGGEIQNIDISLRTFRAVDEDGAWKMCGYAPAAE